MQMLNRYFTPFALVLILSAVYFRREDLLDAGMRPQLMIVAGILVADVIVNWWIGRNLYRWMTWSRKLRVLQVWLNFVWAVPLFYLLATFWGPMWLLFVMAPTAAALTLARTHTIALALVSAGTMISLLWHLQGSLSDVALGMAICHAAFIVIFALFVHGLAETALRLRDVAR